MFRRLRFGCVIAGFVPAGFVAAGAYAQSAPPSTDVFLAPLSVRRGIPTVGAPANFTHRPGYDNQPSFTPDGRAILFTSTRDDGQADIYRYDLATKSMARLTSTAESEYSATAMPDGKRISVIRVERDSTQRLWSFAIDGSDPRLVVKSLAPVGYHVWLDANRLAMFVLGQPNALVIGDLGTAAIDTVARNVGRSLARLPDGSGFSYTQILDSVATVRGMDPITKRTWDLVRLPQGSQDVVWLRDGTLLSASGSKIVAWKKGETGWRDIVDLSRAGIRDVTRLAVAPNGDWIAIVGVPVAK